MYIHTRDDTLDTFEDPLEGIRGPFQVFKGAAFNIGYTALQSDSVLSLSFGQYLAPMTRISPFCQILIHLIGIFIALALNALRVLA